jgi:hypothetical protein
MAEALKKAKSETKQEKIRTGLTVIKNANVSCIKIFSCFAFYNYNRMQYFFGTNKNVTFWRINNICKYNFKINNKIYLMKKYNIN